MKCLSYPMYFFKYNLNDTPYKEIAGKNYILFRPKNHSGLIYYS